MRSVKPILIAGIILAVTWTITLAGVATLRATRVTPESITARLAAPPAMTETAEQRVARIEELAAQVNALPLQQRFGPELVAAIRPWFETLTPAEREHFLDLTLVPSLQQAVAAFSKMDPAGRNRLLTRALQTMRERQEEEAALAEKQGTPPPPRFDPLAGLPPGAKQRIIGEGLGAVMRDMDFATRLQLLPLLMELQDELYVFDKFPGVGDADE